MGRQARWPVPSAQLLRQQPMLSPAVSHTMPGERTFPEEGAGSPQPLGPQWEPPSWEVGCLPTAWAARGMACLGK